MDVGLALAAAAPILTACVLLARREGAPHAAVASTIVAVALAVWL